MSEVSHADLVIEANRESKEYFKDLIGFRELIIFLAWRDILVRYKQASFGIAWALIRPLLNMAMFSLIFGMIAHLPSEGIPYPLFVLAGMLPWQFVSGTAVDTCNSMINNVQLITKIYFPRMILSISQILVQLVDLGINLGLMAILMCVMGVGSLGTIWAFPFFLLLMVVLCAGLGLWLSALTVQYRDFRFIVAFVVQFGMFASPVGYGSFLIPGTLKWVFYLNPMVGIIDGFRWALFGVNSPDLVWSALFSSVISCGLLVSGLRYFRRSERSFADRI